VGDLIRAIDDQARWHSRADAAVLLQRAVDERKPFRVKLVWEAFDADYFAEPGARDGGGSAEQKTLRKLATVKGMTLFRQAVDGTYLPEVDGKSGRGSKRGSSSTATCSPRGDGRARLERLLHSTCPGMEPVTRCVRSTARSRERTRSHGHPAGGDMIVAAGKPEHPCRAVRSGCWRGFVRGMASR